LVGAAGDGGVSGGGDKGYWGRKGLRC